MFMELYKFSKLVMHLNSCSMDLGHDSVGIRARFDLGTCGLWAIVVTQKGGLAFHGIPHRLGKHMEMCL